MSSDMLYVLCCAATGTYSLIVIMSMLHPETVIRESKTSLGSMQTALHSESEISHASPIHQYSLNGGLQRGNQTALKYVSHPVLACADPVVVSGYVIS